MRPFGTDDDSIMHQLANELDIHSAAARLKRVGFRYISPLANQQQVHRFHRMNGEGVETLSITLDNNRFLVSWAYDESKVEYIDVIRSWEQWIDFVRLLVMRSNMRPRMKELPDHN